MNNTKNKIVNFFNFTFAKQNFKKTSKKIIDNMSMFKRGHHPQLQDFFLNHHFQKNLQSISLLLLNF